MFMFPWCVLLVKMPGECAQRRTCLPPYSFKCAPWSWGLSHHAQQRCRLWLCTHHSLNLLHQIRVGTVQSSQCWKGSSPEWSLNYRRMCAVQAKVMLSIKTWPLRLQPVFAFPHTYEEDHQRKPSAYSTFWVSLPSHVLSQAPQLCSQKETKAWPTAELPLLPVFLVCWILSCSHIWTLRSKLPVWQIPAG